MNETPNPYSHLTAKERDVPSLPVRILSDKKLITGRTLDFGCGFGKDVEFLKTKGFDVSAFDPHYFPTLPKGKFDTILCFYVLNVLFPEEQTDVLMRISHLLNPSGTAYFAVRRDIDRNNFRTHHLHKKPVYQCAVRLPYKSVFLNENAEIYEYRHLNQLHESKSSCPFCNPNPRLELLIETPLTYAVLDGYPIAAGHSLVISKTHTDNFFDLPLNKQIDCWRVATKIEKYLRKRFKTNSFTVGMNIGKHAGQKIGHSSIHLIPRYAGDISNPAGGIRNILKTK